ncbi:hypothetical protein KC345_g11153, partial [Hortaea werneckii]
MNVYVPEAYFQGKTVGGYTADTAPIFFPNSVGGYMPGAPGTLEGGGAGGMGGMMAGAASADGAAGGQAAGKLPADIAAKIAAGELPAGGTTAGGTGGVGPTGGAPNGGASAASVALSKGYVVAMPGARGRTTQDADGIYTGKAPAAIVDLKAAVRYLRYNDEIMPGDAEKIISNGTSAGGALSALLGATGNNADYEPYLEAIGAADERDDVFAVSSYTPITNLENADAAYEWQFNDVITYQQQNFSAPSTSTASTTEAAPAPAQTTLTDAQLKISDEQKALFPAYLDSLGLTAADGTALSLNADGSGTFKEYMKSLVVASAQTALNAGTDLSDKTWITIQGGKVTDIDWDQYVDYLGRKKAPSAFDGLDLSDGENSLFGTAANDTQHFTEYSQNNDTADGSTADPAIVKLMNPMSYINSTGTTTSTNWRIRFGTKDSDTSIAVSAMLATELQNNGANVDYALAWDVPHSGDYDLDA